MHGDCYMHRASTPAVESGSPPPAATVTIPSASQPAFGTASVEPDFKVDGAGYDIDSIAFWEAPEPTDTLMFVTAKGNHLVEVWQYPFIDNERPELTHTSFIDEADVNGVAVDQVGDRLYVSVSAPASTVSIFALPALDAVGELGAGSVDLRTEPNLTLLNQDDGETLVYVSADTAVHIYNAETGVETGRFDVPFEIETLLADALHQVIYVPDEDDGTGIYAYTPEGTPYERDGTNSFGGSGIFDADAEGILLYSCPADGSEDDGTGFIVVADQRDDVTEFEFFDRRSWMHLGALTIAGVSKTDGIASTQYPLPDYPLGLFAAIDDDESVAGVGWETILDVTGLRCSP